MSHDADASEHFIAAKPAFDADTEINKKDWSDRDVDAKPYEFYDGDGGETEETDQVEGNNKDYHPEEE